MSEELKQNGSLSPASEEQDVAALIKKMQQQLVFLERKIDLLISKTEAMPVSDRHFSKSARSFGRHYRPYDRKRGGADREEKFDRGRRFEKHDGEKNQGFDRKKKEHESFEENNFNQERHFKKRYDGERGGFNQKKKPFFDRQRKGHR